MNVFLASMNEPDRRIWVIVAVIALVLFLLLGLLGMAIRAVMNLQAQKVDTIMSDTVKTHVVDSPKQFKKLAYKKSNRLLYKQSLIPLAISVTALLIWVFSCIAMESWKDNIFAEFQELFFGYEWNAEAEVYAESPLVVKVFGITLLARFPAVNHEPEFILSHLPAYIEVALFYVSWVWYAVVCQAWISRFIMIQHRSRTIYSKSLKDYKNEEDIHITQTTPPPPSED